MMKHEFDLDSFCKRCGLDIDDVVQSPVCPEHDLHHVDVGEQMIYCVCGDKKHTMKEFAAHCGLSELYEVRIGQVRW